MPVGQVIMAYVGLIGAAGAFYNGVRVSTVIWREIGPVSSIASTVAHAAMGSHILTHWVLGW